MNDHLEESLRRALQPKTPGGQFTERVMSRLEAKAAGAASPPGTASRLIFSRRFSRPAFSRWLPAALAAGLLIAFGVQQLREQSLEHQRAAEAHAQLLLALSIASDDLNAVRAAVQEEERSSP